MAASVTVIMALVTVFIQVVPVRSLDLNVRIVVLIPAVVAATV
jgi:hypothetical protein